MKGWPDFLPPPLFVDFETHVAGDHNLRKQKTVAYVRDPRFFVQCLAWADPVEKRNGVVWHDQDIPAFLDQFDTPNRTLVAHNTFFDGRILSDHYGVEFGVYVCTMSMARALLRHRTEGYSLDAVHEALFGNRIKTDAVEQMMGYREVPADKRDMFGRYAITDVFGMVRCLMRMIGGFPDKQWWHLDWSLRQFIHDAWTLDVDEIEQFLDDYEAESEELYGKYDADKKMFASAQKFVDLLLEHTMLYDPIQKRGHRDGQLVPTAIGAKGERRYDLSKKSEGFIRTVLESNDPTVRELGQLRLRASSSSEASQARNLLDVAQQVDGRFPLAVNYSGCVTHRISGNGDACGINVLAIKRGSRMRNALRAPNGYKVLSFDMSAFELGICRFLAQDRTSIKALGSKSADLYVDFAREAFRDDTITKKKDPDKREVGKVSELQCFAAGTKVLTRCSGWVSIEEIKLTHQVWDGLEWVSHEGVVNQGTKTTIRKWGIDVTPDHIVFCVDGAQRFDSACYPQQTATRSGRPLWSLASTSSSGLSRSPTLASSCALRLWRGGIHIATHFVEAAKSRVHAVLPFRWVQHGAHKETVLPVSSSQAEVYKPEMPGLQKLWRPWDSVLFWLFERSCGLGDRPVGYGTLRRSHAFFGSNRQQRELRAGEFTVSHSKSASEKYAASAGGGFKRWICSRLTEFLRAHESPRHNSYLSNVLSLVQGRRYNRSPDVGSVGKTQLQTERGTQQEPQKVYDLINAGPRHRFTVLSDYGGVLVSNCQYNSGHKTLRSQLLEKGADVTLGEAKELVRVFRHVKHPDLYRYWGTFGSYIPRMRNPRTQPFEVKNAPFLQIEYGGIRLPNDLLLPFPDLKQRDGDWSYRATLGAAYTREKIYGGKLMQYCCQALANVIIQQIKRKIARDPRVRPVHEVYDDVTSLIPVDYPLADIEALMQSIVEPLPWWPELPLSLEWGVGKSWGACEKETKVYGPQIGE